MPAEKICGEPSVCALAHMKADGLPARETVRFVPERVAGAAQRDRRCRAYLQKRIRVRCSSGSLPIFSMLWDEPLLHCIISPS